MQVKFLITTSIGILANTLICAADTADCTSTYPSIQRPNNFNDDACDDAVRVFTPEEIKRVLSTWALLYSNRSETAMDIFLRGFDTSPEFRQYVLKDHYISRNDIPKDKNIKKQSLRTVDTINIVVNSLSHVDAVENYLTYIGKLHKGFGIEKHNFEDFKECSLFVFRKRLNQSGHHFSQEDNIVWNKVFDVILEYIFKGYED
ncbi:uncharacterized protein LOC130670041 [Microplitis mediator]|uniref:uncharacterized protein LOC130670041 n=1 Tax=Microplitis mediator TaxID=375433 RepID=UPI0025527D61|nr:uncharacterized protein LOC130670041 [Microplitis mediator]